MKVEDHHRLIILMCFPFRVVPNNKEGNITCEIYTLQSAVPLLIKTLETREQGIFNEISCNVDQVK